MYFFKLYSDHLPIFNNESYTVVLDGNNCRDIYSLYEQLETLFKLPNYFSYNSDSLYSCLTDLEWLEPYKEYNLVIINPDNLLVDEQKREIELIFFFKNIGSIALSWSTVPNYKGEDEWRHKADFNIYVRKTEVLLKMLDYANIEYVQI